MQLKEVSQDNIKSFIAVNVLLNKQDPHYIRPLDQDIAAVFDPARNKYYRQGETARWILTDDEDQPIGRIAAFVNKKYRNKGDEGPVGGIGFFDCIQNQEAADMLFDVAKHWLLQRGMTAMDGPINFGERDRWWGLVVKGFQPPIYGMNYNPPYYQSLFENYGFKPFYNQICLSRNIRTALAEKLQARHKVWEQDPNFSARPIEKKKLDQYALDFATVYNKAWAGHGGMKEMAPAAARQLFKSMKPVIDEKICWFAYHKNEPIAIYINLPDLNEWFKYLNGQFDLWHKLKFLWIKKTKPCRKCTGIVFGVVPEWQGKGIDAYMIGEAAKIIQHKTDYTDFEMQWIGDFNPKMINVGEGIGDTERSRMLCTYRYLFDRTKPFKRHPAIS